MEAFSEAERRLFTELGYADLLNEIFYVENPISLYEKVGAEVFRDGRTGLHVECLRVGLRAISHCKPWRGTPEFDAMISGQIVAPPVQYPDFDDVIEGYRQGKKNVVNFCIWKTPTTEGFRYQAFLMGEGSEQLIARKEFNSEQEIANLYRSIGVHHWMYI